MASLDAREREKWKIEEKKIVILDIDTPPPPRPPGFSYNYFSAAPTNPSSFDFDMYLILFGNFDALENWDFESIKNVYGENPSLLQGRIASKRATIFRISTVQRFQTRETNHCRGSEMCFARAGGWSLVGMKNEILF